MVEVAGLGHQGRNVRTPPSFFKVFCARVFPLLARKSEKHEDGRRGENLPKSGPGGGATFSAFPFFDFLKIFDKNL